MQQMEDGTSDGKIVCLYICDEQNLVRILQKDKYTVKLEIPSFSLC